MCIEENKNQGTYSTSARCLGAPIGFMLALTTVEEDGFIILYAFPMN
jgi:hypothetical protein